MNIANNSQVPGISIKDLAAMALGIDPNELRDAVIIGALDCHGCDRPHLIKSVTTIDVTDVKRSVLIMALAITELLEKYGEEALPNVE